MNTIDASKNADFFTTYPQDAEGMTERDNTGLSSNAESGSAETNVPTQTDAQAQASAQAQAEAKAQADDSAQFEYNDVKRKNEFKLDDFIRILQSDTLGGKKYVLGSHAKGRIVKDTLESAQETRFDGHHVTRRLKGCFRFKQVGDGVGIERANYRLSVPIKWRTNLGKEKHNKEMRKTIYGALMNEFAGVEVPERIKSAIAQNIKTGEGLGYELGGWNGFHAVESNEVSELLYRYGTVLNTNAARKEILRAALTKAIKETSALLPRFSPDMIKAYLDKYLGVNVCAMGQGRSDGLGELDLDKELESIAGKFGIDLESALFEKVEGSSVGQLKLGENSLNELKAGADQFLASIRKAMPGLKTLLLKATAGTELLQTFESTRLENKVKNAFLRETERERIRELLKHTVEKELEKEGACVAADLDLYCAGPVGSSRGESPLDALIGRLYRKYKGVCAAGDEARETLKGADFIQFVMDDAKSFVKGCQSVRQKVGELVGAGANGIGETDLEGVAGGLKAKLGTFAGVREEYAKRIDGLRKKIEAKQQKTDLDGSSVGLKDETTLLQDVFVGRFIRFFGKEQGLRTKGRFGLMNQEIRAEDRSGSGLDEENVIEDKIEDEIEHKQDTDSFVDNFLEQVNAEDVGGLQMSYALLAEVNLAEVRQRQGLVLGGDLKNDNAFAKSVRENVEADKDVIAWKTAAQNRKLDKKSAVLANLKLLYRKGMHAKSLFSLGQSVVGFSAMGPITLIKHIADVALNGYNTILSGINLKKAQDEVGREQTKVTYDDLIKELRESFTDNALNLDDSNSIIGTLVSKMTGAVIERADENARQVNLESAGAGAADRTEFLKNDKALSGTVLNVTGIVNKEVKELLKSPWTFSFFGKNYYPFVSTGGNRLAAFEKQFEKYLEHVDNNTMLAYLGVNAAPDTANDGEFRLTLKALCRMRLIDTCNSKMQAAIETFAEEIGKEYALRREGAADATGAASKNGFLALGEGSAFGLSELGKAHLKALVTQELDLGFQNEVDELVGMIVSSEGKARQGSPLDEVQHGAALPPEEAKELQYDSLSEQALDHAFASLVGKEKPTKEEVDAAFRSTYPQMIGFYKTVDRAKMFLQAGFLKGIYNDNVLRNYSDKGAEAVKHRGSTEGKAYVESVRDGFFDDVQKNLKTYLETVQKQCVDWAKDFRQCLDDGELAGLAKNGVEIEVVGGTKTEHDWGSEYLAQLCMDEFVNAKGGEQKVSILNALSAKRYKTDFATVLKVTTEDKAFLAKVNVAHGKNKEAFETLRDGLGFETKAVLERMFAEKKEIKAALKALYRWDEEKWNEYVNTQLLTDSKTHELIKDLWEKERGNRMPKAKDFLLPQDQVREGLKQELIAKVAERMGTSWLDAAAHYKKLEAGGVFAQVDEEIKAGAGGDLEEAYKKASDKALTRVFLRMFEAKATGSKLELDDAAYRKNYRSVLQEELGESPEWVKAALAKSLEDANGALGTALTGVVDENLKTYALELARRFGLKVEDLKTGEYKAEFDEFRKRALNAVKARVAKLDSEPLATIYAAICNPGDKEKLDGFSKVVQSLFADFGKTIAQVSVEGLFKEHGLYSGFQGVPKYEEFVRAGQNAVLADPERFADWVLKCLDGKGLRIEKQVITETFRSEIKTGAEVDKATYDRLMETILAKAIDCLPAESAAANDLMVAKWTFEVFAKMSSEGEFWNVKDAGSRKNLVAAAFCKGLLQIDSSALGDWSAKGMGEAYTTDFLKAFFGQTDKPEDANDVRARKAKDRLLGLMANEVKDVVRESVVGEFLKLAGVKDANKAFVRAAVEDYCKVKHCPATNYADKVRFFVDDQLEVLDKDGGIQSRLEAFMKDKGKMTFTEIKRQFTNQLLLVVYENYYLGAAVLKALVDVDSADVVAHGKLAKGEQLPSYAVDAFQKVYHDELAQQFVKDLRGVVAKKVQEAEYDPVKGVWIKDVNGEILDIVGDYKVKYMKCAQTRNWALLQMNKWLFDRGTQFELAYVQSLNGFLNKSGDDKVDYWEMSVFEDVARFLQFSITNGKDSVKIPTGSQEEQINAYEAGITAPFNAIIDEMLAAEAKFHAHTMTRAEFIDVVEGGRSKLCKKLGYARGKGIHSLPPYKMIGLLSAFFGQDGKFHKRLQKCVSRKLSRLFSKVMVASPGESLDANLGKAFGIYGTTEGLTELSFKGFFNPLQEAVKSDNAAVQELASFLECFDLINNEDVAADYFGALALDSVFANNLFEGMMTRVDDMARDVYAKSIHAPSKTWLKEIYSELVDVKAKIGDVKTTKQKDMVDKVTRLMNEFKFYADQFYVAEAKKKVKDPDTVKWIEWYESKDVANIENGFWGKTNNWKKSKDYQQLVSDLKDKVQAE